MELLDDFGAAFAVIDERGKQGVFEAFEELNRLRNAYMLDLIRDRDVPVVIVGVGHSYELAPLLTDYEHVKLTDKSEEEIRQMLRPS